VSAPACHGCVRLRLLRHLPPVLAVLLAVLAPAALAADLQVPLLDIDTAADGGQSLSVSLQILLLMTVLTLLPSIVIMMTAFTRIVVVLAILRQALGLQQTPSNQILVGLALFLTLFVMSPVIADMNTTALEPYLADRLDARAAAETALQPLKRFMLAQTRIDDLALFSELARVPPAQQPQDVALSVLVPAFMTSELKTAFQIGFLLFIPFLVIDLVVASVLMSMGMVMLSPLIVSLPFKIMLFVMVDGWVMVMGSLAGSFAPALP
jgi:flagellar biosynthetic protein FliP